MDFLFSTGSLYTYGISRCFALAAEVGFDGIELLIDERWDTRQAAYLRALMDQHSLPVRAVHSPFRPIRGWAIEEAQRIRKATALAETLDAGIVVHHLPMRVGYGTVTMGARRWIIPLPRGSMGRAYRDWIEDGYAAFQKEVAPTLCIENMPARRTLGRRWNAFHWNTVQGLSQFESMTMDTTHLGTWGLDPATVYATWQPKVKHVHLSNFDGQEHRRPEMGKLDLGRFLAKLAESGYDGAITLELCPAGLEAGCSDDEMRDRLTTSLKWCRQHT
jgi:sugar phosphate isomerase/epimerase